MNSSSSTQFFTMWLMICVIVILLVYLRTIKPLQYWKNRRILYVTPWPIFGNIASLTFKKRAFPYLLQDLYNAFPNKRYLGFFHFSTPILMLRDPELIKQICIKNFDYFPNRQQFLPDEADPFWDRNLLALSGERWKSMRATVTPAFTVSKMQMMFSLINDCAKRFTRHYLDKNETVTLEMKDAFTRFTNDVTASTIFGVTCDSLENGDNKFYIAVKKASNFGGGLKSLKLYGYTICPQLMKLLNITFFEDEVKKYFCQIVSETIAYRKTYDIIRPDMIHLLVEAKTEQLKKGKGKEDSVLGDTAILKKLNHNEITEEDITAQAFIFFLGGFDTSSTLMCYMTYELAINPDIQTRLVQEIDRTLTIEYGEINYTAVMNMPYLDMVVNETLRKWPPSAFTSRVVTKSFTIEPNEVNESEAVLEPGTICWIPIYAIHRDQRYYPHPDRFEPERFSERRKSEIHPSTFLPFGLGPRNCIGSRFAVIKAKTIILQLLSKFEIIPVDKTDIPLTFSKSGMNMMSAKGIWLGLKPRKATTNSL